MPHNCVSKDAGHKHTTAAKQARRYARGLAIWLPNNNNEGPRRFVTKDGEHETPDSSPVKCLRSLWCFDVKILVS